MTTPAPAEVTQVLRGAGCVWAEDEAALLIEAADADDGDVWTLVRRRMAGEPIEQVVGWAELCGLRVGVEPGVFVPRRRSESLARAAIAAAVTRGPVPVVVDLCCGAGGLALVVASALPEARVFAADIDEVAVRCAERNLAGTNAFAATGDLFDALPPQLRGGIDVLVANAPYVPTGRIATLPAEARVYEPRHALDGGVDGVDLHRRIAADAAKWLAPGGVALVETSAGQAPATVAALAAGGLIAEVRPTAGDVEADEFAVVAYATRP